MVVQNPPCPPLRKGESFKYCLSIDIMKIDCLELLNKLRKLSPLEKGGQGGFDAIT